MTAATWQKRPVRIQTHSRAAFSSASDTPAATRTANTSEPDKRSYRRRRNRPPLYGPPMPVVPCPLAAVPPQGDQPCGYLLTSVRDRRPYLSADPLRALPLFLAARAVPPLRVPGAHEVGRCSQPCHHRQADWGHGQSTRDPAARPLAPPDAAPGAHSARFAAQARTHVPAAALMADVCPVGSVPQLPPSAAGHPLPVDTQGGGRFGQRSRIKSRCHAEAFITSSACQHSNDYASAYKYSLLVKKGLSRLHPAEARSTDLPGSLDA